MNKRKLVIIIGVLAAVIVAGALSVYAAWPVILLKFYPEKYVNYAVANTLKDLTIFDNSNKSSKLFNKIYKSPSTYNFGLTVNDIEISGFFGTEIVAGMGVDVSLIVDRDKDNAGLDLKLKKSSTPIISAKGYVSNNDFGGIVPEVFSRYIVADTKDFAYNWNNSILGSNFQIDERIDIDNMYNIIFPKPAETDEKSIYEEISAIALPYADKLSYKGMGTVSTTYNGAAQELSRIDVTLKKEDAKQFAEQLIGLFDSSGIESALYEAGKYTDTDMIANTDEQIKNYFESTTLNKDLVLELYFSKNKVAKINIEAELIGIENLVFGISTDVQLADKIIESDTELKVFIPKESVNIFDSKWHIIYDQNSPENNMILDMTMSSPDIFDAAVNIEYASGFDEKNVSVYSNIKKLEADINYGEDNLSVDAKLNFSCQEGIGKGVVVPDDSINITEASQAEVFEIYTEVLSNLDEILKLVNLGSIF